MKSDIPLGDPVVAAQFKQQTLFMRILTLLLASSLAGCSLAAHTPTIVMSEAGYYEDSLAQTEPYSRVFEQTVVLADGEGKYWTLREFSSGDRFLQYSPQLEGASYSSQLVARLDGQAIRITSIYNDKLNGGTFFDAVLLGERDQPELRRARWNDVLLSYARP